MNSSDSDNITSLIKSIYHPSIPERKLKAKFWVIWNDGISKGVPTKEDIIDVLNEKSLKPKLDDGAFVAWFLNEYEAAQQLAYLSQLSLEILEDMMMVAEKDSDRLKAISLVLDLVKATKKEEDTKKLPGFDDMDEAELDKYIESQVKVIDKP